MVLQNPAFHKLIMVQLWSTLKPTDNIIIIIIIIIRIFIQDKNTSAYHCCYNVCPVELKQTKINKGFLDTYLQ